MQIKKFFQKLMGKIVCRAEPEQRTKARLANFLLPETEALARAFEVSMQEKLEELMFDLCRRREILENLRTSIIQPTPREEEFFLYFEVEFEEALRAFANFHYALMGRRRQYFEELRAVEKVMVATSLEVEEQLNSSA